MPRAMTVACLTAFGPLVLAATASAQTGTIAGVVTNAATGQGVTGVAVWFCTGSNTPPTCVLGMTNAQGLYSMVVPAGTHYGFTDNAPQLINQVYDGIACPQNLCGGSLAVRYGTPTAVSAGQTVSRDFRLAPASAVRGSVRDAASGSPLVGVEVQLYGLFQGLTAYYGLASTDASGAYTIGNLPAGTFYAITSQSTDYVDQVFAGISCPSQCNSSHAFSGTPIVVAAGSQTTGRDFALRRGGSISGTVTGLLAPGNVAPVAGATVFVSGLLSGSLASGGGTTTDPAGHYSVTGLADGLYYLQVRPPTADGFLGQFYGGAPCGEGCGGSLPIDGIPISVAGGQPTIGRDIQLARGGSIAGIVTASATLLPAPNVLVTAAAIVDGGARYFGTAQTDALGAYTIPALPPGMYSLTTYNFTDFIDEAYPNVTCPVRCDPLVAATMSVPVAQYATTSGRNFSLDPAGSIMGVITDAATSTPLTSVFVNLYARVGSEVVAVDQQQPDVSGVHTFRKVPAGRFWAAAFPFRTRVRSQIFDGIACPALDCGGNAAVAGGTPIVVEPPTPYTGVNFTMSPGQAPPFAPIELGATTSGFRVRLAWTAHPSGPAPAGYIVEAGFSPGSTAITLPTTGPVLEVGGVPPGRYFVRVRATNAFGAGPPSSEIVLTVNGDGAGSPNAVPSLTAWMSGRRLNLLWSDSSLGERPTNYLVDVGSAAGLSNIASLSVTTRSFSYEPVPDGFYFLRVRARLGANAAPASPEVMVKVGGVPSPPSAPLRLRYRLAGNSVTFSWAAPIDGSPTSYVVEAGSQLGLSNLAVFNTGNTATTLTVPNVPRGTYYVRLRAVNALGAGPPSGDALLIIP